MLYIADVTDGDWDYSYYAIRAESHEDAGDRLLKSLKRTRLDYKLELVAFDENGVARVGGGSVD
jgi:hypothetical protein